MGKSEEQEIYPGYRYQELFNLMSNDHGLTLLEDEMNQIIDVVRRIDSHSQTEPVSAEIAHTEFDTLHHGDWFQGTEEEYGKVSSIWKYSGLKLTIIDGCCIVGVNGSFYGLNNYYPDITEKTTQLTAPEFIRRAENTFKMK